MPSYLVSGRCVDCCGCGACAAVCPKNCITITAGAEGFLFPKVDKDACVSCGLCEKVCPYTTPIAKREPNATYGAVNKLPANAKAASSAGVFHALASAVIRQGGVAFGAVFEDGYVCAHHMAETEEQLSPMRKSKYVQSNTRDTYRQAKQHLRQGRTVLYSGTPCQIAGLLSYVGDDRENLITVDVACHGVPSQIDFDACLAALERKYGHITDFTFRDKEGGGWNHCLGFTATKNGKSKRHTLPPHRVPYYFYFLRTRNLRESCYACPYVGTQRVSDITLSDFWGAESVLPSVPEHGVSAVLCNSAQGAALFACVRDDFDVYEVDMGTIARRNQPFRGAVRPYGGRAALLAEVTKNGYTARACGHISKKERLVAAAKAVIPAKIKRMLSK